MEKSSKVNLAIFSAGLMTFIGILNETSMNVTYPLLVKEFHQPLATVQVDHYRLSLDSDHRHGNYRLPAQAGPGSLAAFKSHPGLYLRLHHLRLNFQLSFDAGRPDHSGDRHRLFHPDHVPADLYPGP